MQFTSIYFILFVTAVALLYFLFRKNQWVVLLISSCIFFYINSGLLIIIFLTQTIVSYYTGVAIYKKKTEADQYIMLNGLDREQRIIYISKSKATQKKYLFLGVAIVLGALLFLKYYNFAIKYANKLITFTGICFPSFKLLLPIGISFYTLQAIAYMVDIYRGKAEASFCLWKYMLFMGYFPQIVQGPIPRYRQLYDQLTGEHGFDLDRCWNGIRLIIWGLMKKLIIADRIAIPVSMVFDNYSSYKGLIVFFASACYGVQVYADFSGGMDIARGFSQIIGIDLILNFNQPYFSSSVEEFWRRWHISLGSFMRDYIFYPLSLSKVFAKIGRKARSLWGNEIGKKIPPFLAMFIVYFLVGLWHGASMKFIIYGIWNGMFIALGILLTDKYAAVKKKCHIDEEAFSWRLFQRIRTFILISIGRIFSRAKDTRSALSMFESMITKHFDFSFLLDGTLRKLGLDTANWIILMVAVVLMLVVDIYHEKGLSVREFIDSQGLVFRIIVTAGAIVAVVILGIYGPGYDSTAFIYQQF